MTIPDNKNPLDELKKYLEKYGYNTTALEGITQKTETQKTETPKTETLKKDEWGDKHPILRFLIIAVFTVLLLYLFGVR